MADLHSNEPKTPMMKYLEYKHGKTIEELLQGSLADCAKRLGTNRTTVAKWKRRLGLDSVYRDRPGENVA
jgi:transcriptional regulator with GAF, ATPase, and Fis domain